MPSYAEQVDIILRVLSPGTKISKDSPVFRECIKWIANFPSKEVDDSKKVELVCRVKDVFEIDEPQLYATISGIKLAPRIAVTSSVRGEEELYSLLPRSGWLADYAAYTEKTESPLSYHLFSSLCTLGCALGRRVWMDMGFYKLYPNYAVILVGPPAKTRKTSAVNIAKGFVDKLQLCPVMADKLTPEALMTALERSGTHFVYAPEFSLLLNRQRYNEGLSTLFLRIMDCPDNISVETVTHGFHEAVGVTPTVLGCSTQSLLANSTPGEVTSSGFLSRFLMVCEVDTKRNFPVPERGPVDVGERLTSVLEYMKGVDGEIKLSIDGRKWYDNWYAARKEKVRTTYDETTAEILARFPDHLLRTAMLIHVSHCQTQLLCEECLRTAGGLLNYAECSIPGMVTAIGHSMVAQDTEFVIEALRRLGGAADHSKLLRRVSSRMGASSFKQHLQTLVEQRRIKSEKKGVGQYYVLLEDN